LVTVALEEAATTSMLALGLMALLQLTQVAVVVLVGLQQMLVLAAVMVDKVVQHQETVLKLVVVAVALTISTELLVTVVTLLALMGLLI
jgi:hypothetical protein